MEALRRAFRGYDCAQTDSLLADLRSKQESLTRDLDQLRNENDRLRLDLSAVNAGLQERRAEEQAVKDALVTAHRKAEEVLQESRKEAEVLLQVAREAGARMQEDLRGRIADLNWQIERLDLQRQRFTQDFQELLEGHLAQLATQQPAPSAGDRAAIEIPLPMPDQVESTT